MLLDAVKTTTGCLSVLTIMTVGNYIVFWASSILVVVYAVTTDASCQLPLGLESGAILNSQLSSSSSVSVLKGPRFARLHRREGDGGWTATTENENQYLTIDLVDTTRVTGVATQGNGAQEYTMKYKLQYSDDGNSWETYMENGQEKVLPGNQNGDKVHRNDLSSSFDARYVRINPTQWNVAPSMRVELYGCLADETNMATFDGSTYIKYDISNPREYIQTNEELIQFKMRTDRPDGVIVASYGTQSDYIVLQLKQGKMVLSIDLGTSGDKSGATVLEAGSLLDDNQWHFVQYKRKEKLISITIDGVTFSEKTNGYFKRLDLDTEMTIGGAVSMTKPGIEVNNNFIGCLQSIALSNSISDNLSLALYFISAVKKNSLLSVQGTLTNGCTGGVQAPATFPTQDSYLKWPGPSSGNNFTVKFKFRTFDKNGLVIYNKMEGSNAGYMAVGLKDGVVNLAIKVGNSPIIEIPGEKKFLNLDVAAQNTSTTQKPMVTTAGPGIVKLHFTLHDEGTGLANGKWHDVRAEVANSFIKVMVNGDTQEIQKSVDVRTGGEYFIGGSTLPQDETADMTGFRGCLKGVYLGDTMVDFLSIQEDEVVAGVMNEGVDVDTCGLQDWCTPSPCAHGSQCYTDWDNFICSCRGTGYSGATCHSTDRPRACEYTGSHSIDVDGSGPLAPFDVECEEDEDGVLHTIISHNTESLESIPDGNGDAGSYMKDVMYGSNGDEVGRDHLKSLTEAAEYCEQNIKYQCTKAKLLNSPSGPPIGWWVNIHNDKMNYWGGAAPNTGKCKCGMDLTCADRNKFCNCDKEGAVNLVDEGLLTDKDSLPVMQLRFGDRADSSSSSSYELGKLRCKGSANAEKVVTFQSEEAHLRFPISTTKQNALDISVEFKTLTTGVVLLSADGPDDSFIQLELEDATRVLFSVNFGADLKTVRAVVSDPLNDDEWHRLQASLDNQEISIKVDQELPKTEAIKTGSLHLQLTSDLYVGSSTLQSDGYVGCMRSLYINGEFEDLTAKSAQGVIEGCVGMCTEDKCFNGGQCEEFYDKFMCQCSETPFEGEFCSDEIGAKLESDSEISYNLATSQVKDYTEDVITLGFNTKEKHGVLLRVDDGTADGEYEEVSILNTGRLQYSFRLGTGDEVQMSFNDHDFADGKHHFVEINRNGKDLRLQVGDFPPIIPSVDFSDTTLSGANRIVVGGNFTGCISRVQFNGIAPVKLYFGDNRPPTLAGTGTVTKSRCGVEAERPPTEVMPTSLPKVETTTNSGLTDVAIAPQQGYKPGDKAAIAIVILLLLLALILLIVFIARYKYKHKGVYKTNEARGADTARDADTAVMMSDTKQPKFEKKKEWYI